MEPVPGDPWHSVPFSQGHVLEPVRGAPLKLRVYPDMACPIQAHPEDGQLVPVTSKLKDDTGREWYLVEFRQQILWTPVDPGHIRISLAGRLRQHGTDAAGYRSCEPVVMLPPLPHIWLTSRATSWTHSSGITTGGTGVGSAVVPMDHYRLRPMTANKETP